MKRMKKLIAALASIALVAGLSGCGLISKTPEGINATVVAKINDQKITKGEFDKRFQRELVTYQMQYGEDFATKKENQDQVTQLKTSVLSQMTNEVLLLQEAKKANLIDEKTLQDETKKLYDEQVKQMGGEDALKKQLETFKYSQEDFNNELRNSVLINKLYENVTKDVVVTDDDAKKYYDENKYEFTEKPDKMNISHILVATEQEAKDIKAKLDKGEKFEDLAKQYSTDSSKDQGGLLGDFEYANSGLDQTFFLNAVSLKDGQISNPFQTQFGWHIVRMNKKEEYPMKSFDSVKEDIKKSQLDTKKQEAFSNKVTEWTDKAKIKQYPEKL